MAKTKFTMADIAKLAGVSKITVSRAFRDGFAMNPETKTRILKIAAENGFQINQFARSLKSSRSYIIGVVIDMHPSPDRHMSDSYPLGLIGGILQTLTISGYSLLLTTIGEINSSFMSSLDGLILLGQGTNDDAVRTIEGLKIPMVVWGSLHKNANYCVVGSDNFHGGELSAERLIDLGRRRLVFLGDIRHAEIADRFEGFKSAAQKGGAEIIAQISCDFTFSAGLGAAESLISHGAKFDGVMASSDILAMGFARGLIEANIQIPQQVSIIGYDDTQMGASFAPPLTSIHQKWREGGEKLADKILEKIEGKNPQSELLPTNITVRAS